MPIAERQRDYVGVRGPDAGDFLQRMLSNDVTEAPCDALLLTPKGRIIAPMRVVRRADDDFLLLTERGLGETVRSALLRARFAAKCEIEPEAHTSALLWDGDFSVAEEQLDAGAEPTATADDLERARIEAGVPAWGNEIDESILPAEAGLDRTHVPHQGLLSRPGAGRPATPSRAREPRAARVAHRRACRVWTFATTGRSSGA